MGEASEPHFSCFVWRSVRRWESCPYGCSIIRDLNSLPSSLAGIKFLQSPSQKWVRQILISPLKNLNYHGGNRKVTQQLSLSARRWASARHGASGAAARGAISATFLTTEEQTFRGVRLTLRKEVLAFFFWGCRRLWTWLCVGGSPGKEGSWSRALLHSWTRRLFAARCPGWQRSRIGVSDVNWR